MRVRVKFFAFFRDVFGGGEREIGLDPPADVRKLLEALCGADALRKELFEGEDLKPQVVVIKNGLSVHSPQGLKTPLEEGDTVAVFPFMGGG